MFVKLKRAWPEHLDGLELRVVVDKIVAVNDCTVAEKAHARYGLPRRRVQVISPGYDFIVWGSVEDVTAAIRSAFLTHQGDLEAIRKEE